MLPIGRPCTYEKLLLQYVNNRYSHVSCMSMRSSELSDLEKKNVGEHQLDLFHLGTETCANIHTLYISK